MRRVAWKHTPYVKQRANGNFLYDSGNSNWGSATTQRGEKGREVGGRFKKEGTFVYLWLIHVNVWQKSNQYCKGIILQLKINIFLKDLFLCLSPHYSLPEVRIYIQTILMHPIPVTVRISQQMVSAEFNRPYKQKDISGN